MYDSRWLQGDFAFMLQETSQLFTVTMTSRYRREVYYSISMEDGYRYTMPDVLPDSPVEIPDWAKPVLHNFVRNLKGNVLPVHQFAARYTGLIPPTNPEEFNWELSENDKIVEFFSPEMDPKDATILNIKNSGIFLLPDHHIKK